jgi:hypothetical protein
VSALERQCGPPVFRESLSFESEPSTEKRKAQIHQLELRIRRGNVSRDKLLAARDSLDWALDRIVFYAACGAGLLPDVQLSDVVTALKREEEQARTRDLVRGLQPLYYAIECVNERLTPPVDPSVAHRLSETLDSIDRFIQAHAERDSGAHLRGRIATIRHKLEN